MRRSKKRRNNTYIPSAPMSMYDFGGRVKEEEKRSKSKSNSKQKKGSYLIKRNLR